MFNPKDRDFANEVPTSKEPNSPGPLVKAIEFICSFSIPDS